MKQKIGLKDIDIRKRLLSSLNKAHYGEPDTLIIEELGLCQGDARIDVAVINGSMEGYEIKSERDVLKRLPGQVEIYNRILDTITIVASTRHIKKVRKIVPRWWGISEVVMKAEAIQIKDIRDPKKNPKIDPKAVVQLLWRDEALAALESIGLSRGVVSKPRNVLWDRLVENLNIYDLCALVRNQLRIRPHWRSAE